MARPRRGIRALDLWAHKALDELPVELRSLLEERWIVRPQNGQHTRLRKLPKEMARDVKEALRFLSWNSLTLAQRLKVLKDLDAQNPVSAVDQYDADQLFRKGARKVANKRNAKRSRLSSRKVQDNLILRVYEKMVSEGCTPRCSEAYRRLFPSNPPVTLRALRYRWEKLGLNKKGS